MGAVRRLIGAGLWESWGLPEQCFGKLFIMVYKKCWLSARVTLDDILIFKIKNLHGIPFIQRVEFSIPFESKPEPRKRAKAGLSRAS